MSSFQYHDELQAIVSDYKPLDDNELEAYAVDGKKPGALVCPDSVDRLASLVRFASEHSLAVVPRGSGSKMAIGHTPDRVDLMVSLERLNQIVEHEPADQTATIQAGIRFADLQRQLGERGQYVALDPPHRAICTLGGVIAANSSGLLRWSYGTARDMVIGARVVQADGAVVKSGGKVVKNVAGYDLNKLYIGSLGTLGIVAEITLKLQPLPETRQVIIGRFPFVSSVMDAAFSVLDGSIMPSFLEVANPVPLAILARRAGGGFGDAGFPLIVGAIGSEETVSWQIEETERLFHKLGAVQVNRLGGEGYELAMEVLQEFPTGQVVPRGMLPGVVARASVTPEDIGKLYQVAEDRCQKLAMGCAMASHFGNGAVTFVFYQDQPFDTPHLDALDRLIKELQDKASESGGALVVEHAPVSLKNRIAVWGPPRDEWAVMKALKQRFDPNQTLNPGRFVGGI